MGLYDFVNINCTECGSVNQIRDYFYYDETI